MEAFEGIYRMWEPKAFEVQAAFAAGDDVAMFGAFTYRSHAFGKTVTSPFALHAKVTGGKIAHVMFLEDTFATTASVRSGGEARFQSLDGEVRISA